MKTIRAIVTGASSGIGRAAAELLADSGVEVVAASRRIELLRSLRSKCAIYPCDVTKVHSCRSLVGFSRTKSERWPVLVNAAGYAEFGDFAQESDDEVEEPDTTELSDFEERSEMALLQEAERLLSGKTAPIERYVRSVQTNLLGPMHLTQLMIPWMLEAGGGHIVNVLSIAAVNPFSGAAAYCASKAGLHMFGRSIAAEYRSRGIRVTSLLPGSTDTSLWDRQPFKPDEADMLPPRAVAECIRDVVLSPIDRSYDEIVLMPPKGIL